MFFDDQRKHGLRHNPFKALVAPRPIADRIIRDGMIDMAAYRPVARLGYMDYTSVETVFEMLRPD